MSNDIFYESLLDDFNASIIFLKIKFLADTQYIYYLRLYTILESLSQKSIILEAVSISYKGRIGGGGRERPFQRPKNQKKKAKRGHLLFMKRGIVCNSREFYPHPSTSLIIVKFKSAKQLSFYSE